MVSRTLCVLCITDMRSEGSSTLRLTQNTSQRRSVAASASLTSCNYSIVQVGAFARPWGGLLQTSCLGGFHGGAP